MEPGSENPGYPAVQDYPDRTGIGFNGAGVRKPRIQMSKADLLKWVRELQWSRGPKTPDTRWGLTYERVFTCFNGAGVRKPRIRYDTGLFRAASDAGFNGAGVRKPRIRMASA